MDLSFVCKFCNKLFEISLADFDEPIRNLILKVKQTEKDNISKSQTSPNLANKESNLILQNPPNMEINGIDMSFVKVDRISIREIITNLNMILENKICDLCYKELSRINREEIKKLNEEINQIEKTKKILKKEIESNNKEINAELIKKKSNDAKAQEAASKRLNEDTIKLQNEFDNNVEKLKEINEEEKKILDEINDLNINTLLSSKDYEIEKSIQQKNQFEQFCLLNSNILESLFEIRVNEKYGIINGCKMQYKNYSSFNEIFAGWGHILYLTKILNLKAKKFLKILEEIDAFKIYCVGDYSYIYNSKENQKYFFFERNQELNDNLKATKLNQSMIQYLLILKDLDNKMFKITGGVSGLKNFIIKQKSINNYSIELNIYTPDDNDWVLCMKSLLILLKYYINVILAKDNEEMKNILDNKI